MGILGRYSPAMSKGSAVADRLKLLLEGCGGSIRALSRWSTISDPGLARWMKGATPLSSKLKQFSKATGVSLRWLEKGEGDAATEIAKCPKDGITTDEEVRIQETANTLGNAVDFITQHGTAEERAMLESLIESTRRRIEDRGRGAGTLSRGVKYH